MQLGWVPKDPYDLVSHLAFPILICTPSLRYVQAPAPPIYICLPTQLSPAACNMCSPCRPRPSSQYALHNLWGNGLWLEGVCWSYKLNSTFTPQPTCPHPNAHTPTPSSTCPCSQAHTPRPIPSCPVVADAAETTQFLLLAHILSDKWPYTHHRVGFCSHNFFPVGILTLLSDVTPFLNATSRERPGPGFPVVRFQLAPKCKIQNTLFVFLHCRWQRPSTNSARDNPTTSACMSSLSWNK